MTRLLVCLALVCLASAAATAERLPADCRWVLHADLRAMFSSSLGEWLGAEMVKQPHAARLQLLESITGLQPQRDLRTATICGVGADDDTSLVYVRGTFDPARLTTMAQATDGYAPVKVGSRTIHTWLDKGKPAAGCLVGTDLLILGKTSQRIRTALELIDNRSRPAAAFKLPAGWNGASLVVCAADRIDALVAGKPESAMLGNLSSFAARLTEDGRLLALDARAAATSAEAARQMVDAGRGLVAIVQLQRQDKLDPGLAQAVQTALLDRDGADVTLRLAMPVEEILRLISQGKGR